MRIAAGNNGRIRPCTAVFLLLVALTLVTWGVGVLGIESLWLSMMVFGFALLKAFLIGDWFMGLNVLQGLWRWVIVIWLLIPGLLVTTAFLLTEGGGL